MLEQLEDDIEVHGEVHVTVDGIDSEVEMRKGQTTFHDSFVSVWDGSTHHNFAEDNIVHWYEPRDIFNE